MTTGAAAGAPKRVSLSAQIAIGVLAGAVLGVLIGDYTAPLQVVADAYVRLLQMTVLPYVTVSIVGALGALSAAQIRDLAKRVGVILLLVWAVGLAIVFLFPLMFPTSRNASFFSTTMLEQREPMDFLSLYIPTNPFYSLANNIVPAVVLFSLILGVSLSSVSDKMRLLDVLATVGRAVAKAAHFVLSLTPYGVFAISAVVVGTTGLAELQRMEVYVVTFIVMSLVVSLWVLPGLVAALTPIPYRAMLSRTRDALIMAFMTTSLFAVLPLLTEEAKALVRDYAKDARLDEAAVDVIVPASFNFPHMGKVLSLSFVLFAGWFTDARVSIADYPRLGGTGLVAMFASSNAAIPMLLDMLRIPADTFNLFVASGVVNARFGSLVAAVHTLTVALLGACAVQGALRFDVRRIARFAGVTVVLLAGVIGGTNLLLARTIDNTYSKDQILINMEPLRNRGEARVLENDSPGLPPAEGSILDRVNARGAVRVGYVDDSLPYAFENGHGELVGFDIEMAHQLARDLGVALELVRLDRSVLAESVDAAVCDVVMSGVAVTTQRSLHLGFTTSYLDETIAFVVPDHRLSQFSDWSSVRAMGRIRVGVPQSPYYMQKIQDELPEAEIVPVNDIQDMFGPAAPTVDAFVLTAERGSAYTLLHPEFSVAVPKPRLVKVPLAYVVAGRDAPMTSMLDTWIDLKRKDGTIDELFSHWILGQNSAPRTAHWSVLRNVLHWVG